jgi:hypothetical protein
MLGILCGRCGCSAFLFSFLKKIYIKNILNEEQFILLLYLVAIAFRNELVSERECGEASSKGF